MIIPFPPPCPSHKNRFQRHRASAGVPNFDRFERKMVQATPIRSPLARARLPYQAKPNKDNGHHSINRSGQTLLPNRTMYRVVLTQRPQGGLRPLAASRQMNCNSTLTPCAWYGRPLWRAPTLRSRRLYLYPRLHWTTEVHHMRLDASLLLSSQRLVYVAVLLSPVRAFIGSLRDASCNPVHHLCR